MAIEEVALNTTEVLNSIQPFVADKILGLITLFKAVGVVILVYLLFLIIKSILSWRDHSRLKKIARNVEQINNKLDVLTKKKSVKGKKN